MFLFYGPFKFREILKRSLHSSSVMKKPRENEMYLSNFGVNSNYRSKGIGTVMLNKKIAEAKNMGYKKFILDVSDKNPRAEALYKRMGLEVTKTKVFSGKPNDSDFPKSKQMELILTPSNS
jgi:ribosomal protein S18 acetylase RimI-like enzyme